MAITEYRWQSGGDFSVSLGTSGTTSYTTIHPIRGYVEAIEWKTSSTGSLFLVASGTNRVIYSNNTPSGTNWQIARTYEYPSTGSPYVMVPRAVHEPLVVTISGTPSGTATVTGQFVIRYSC
jgi:hypothetical protein